MKRIDLDSKEALEFQVSHNKVRIKKTDSKARSRSRVSHINTIKEHVPGAVSVLCLGCRSVSELDSFRSHGLTPTGVDILQSVDYIVMDVHEIEDCFEENSFDFVYASHVLEHMYDPIRVLQGIKKVSRLGAFIVLPSWSPELPNYVKRISPSQSHPVIFDLMSVNRRQLSEVTQEDLSDFREMEPFNLKYYKKIDRYKKTGMIDECELLFIWSGV